ncbi:MAG: carboxypeptidase-like regulatory domain-containing protein [Bacteroidetes bacterium]|nr:MAG: carboxypeptidase-like regulatory domain-containing protein [Bacteroidota bacterium]
MKKKITLRLDRTAFILSFFLFLNNSRAQESPVSFKIINQKREPVAFATLIVVNRTDSTKKDQKVTDSTGLITFGLLKGNQYIVTVSSVNYQPLEKGIIVTDKQLSFTLSLEALPKTLSGVVVTSSKPLMRQEDDVTII